MDALLERYIVHEVPVLDVLTRWNRWGTARLAAGLPRDVLASVLPFLGTGEVVAIVGPRRTGKTTLLFQLMDALQARGVPKEAVLHLNLEEPALQPKLGVALLDEAYQTYREAVFPRGRAYVFLDEVQHVPGWERWARARGDTEDLKVFVTGSSASLLSRELGTLLTGRHVQFTVWPLGFGEFLRFRGIEAPRRPSIAGTPALIQHALAEYVRWGGFPEVVLAADEERRQRLLIQYFDDVLFKDVALRHEVRDLVTLRTLAVHLLTATASLVSYQRIAGTFGISLDLARAYCGYLEEAFVVTFASAFSLKVAERRRSPQKVHAVDTGLRNAVCLSGGQDRGRLAETAVFASLRRAGESGLFYWRGRGEVDVLRRVAGSTDALVQVALDVRSSKDVLAREVGALEEARAAHPAAPRVLVVDRPLGPAAGEVPRDIAVVPLWRFLLEDLAVAAARPTTSTPTRPAIRAPARSRRQPAVPHRTSRRPGTAGRRHRRPPAPE